MRIGVLFPCDDVVERRAAEFGEMGFTTCQLVCSHEGLSTASDAEHLAKTIAANGMEITAVWSRQEGPVVWDFPNGPLVIGIVPRAYRYERMKTLIRVADFASLLGVRNVAMHAGFIPENPSDGNYGEVVCALKYIVQHLEKNGQSLLLETGQETPVTLKRTIDDVGMGNIGVNFDPANFLMYGKGNPLDALEILHGHLMGFHAKDGEYPTNGYALGVERPLGEGRVDYPRLIEKLKEMHFDSPLTIEREIGGPQQVVDIARAKEYLEQIL